MNKIKLSCLASLLATGIAHASGSCDGFEIKVKNNLAEDLLIRKIHLQGADIQPCGLQKLNNKSEEIFTINKASDLGVMKGELIFNTISLPSREVRIQFDLENKSLICEHTDYSRSKELSLSKTRLPGKVNYTISN